MVNVYNVLAALPALGGCICLFIFFKHLYFYLVTLRSWVRADGKIVEIKIYFEDDGDTGGWSNKIVYQYEVDGELLIGDTLEEKNILTPFKYQQEDPELFVNKRVKIWYNPENPQQSLFHRYSHIHVMPLLFGIICFAVSYYNFT